MRVEMRRSRVWQDAGTEVQLDFGRQYELPDLVAAALIASGAAVRLDAPEIAAMLHVPETAAARGPVSDDQHRRRRKAS